MAFFKAVCSKNNQKIDVIIQFDTLEQAKDNLHKQWYAIIQINETQEYTNINNTETFFFDIMIDWKIKTWQIQSNDYFKAYIKLVDDLHYDIIYLYDRIDTPKEDKIIITQKIKLSYEIYKNSKKEQDKKVEEVKLDKQKDKNSWKNDALSEFLLKDLNKYYILIDKVIEKINFILENFKEDINNEKRLKLINLYQALKQVKNITNIIKLKQIWETSLLKVWEFQMELISQNIMKWKKEILKETNKLLKAFWSNKQVILPEDDIKIKLKNLSIEIINEIKEFLKFFKRKNLVEKNSWKYYNLIRELQIFKQKNKNINLNIIKNIFNKPEYERLVLKKKLIKQNIFLRANHINNKKISYIRAVKWIVYFKDIIMFLVQKIWDFIIYSIFIYSIFFIYLNIYFKIFDNTLDINYNIINNILIFSILWFLLKISKNFTLFVFSIFIYILSLIYIIVNF